MTPLTPAQIQEHNEREQREFAQDMENENPYQRATALHLTIKFSHDYEKLPLLWENTRAVLLRVQRVRLEDQSFAFIDYDTKIRQGGYYPLPKAGDFIVLLFQHETGMLFTTIRRYTYEKKEFYLNHRQESFRLIKVPPEGTTQTRPTRPSIQAKVIVTPGITA